MTWAVTDKNGFYYQGIARRITRLLEDDILMTTTIRRAKTFPSMEHASASAKRLGIRFGMNLKAEKLK